MSNNHYDKEYHSKYQKQRTVVTYPKPKYVMLIVADAHENSVSVSSHVSKLIEKHYDNLPANERVKLLSTYNKLEPDEIKRKK